MAIAVAVLLVATLFIVAIVLVLQLGRTQSAVRAASAERDQLARQAATLGAQVQAFAKYQHIVDAEAAAIQLHAAAQQHATGIVAQAQQEANRILTHAHATLGHATSEGARIMYPLHGPRSSMSPMIAA